MLSYKMWLITKCVFICSQNISSAHGNYLDSSIQSSNKKQSHVPLNKISTAGYQTHSLLLSWKYKCLPNNFSSVWLQEIEGKNQLLKKVLDTSNAGLRGTQLKLSKKPSPYSFRNCYVSCQQLPLLQTTMTGPIIYP